MDGEWELRGKWVGRTYLGLAGRTQVRMKNHPRADGEHNAVAWVTRIDSAPGNWNAVRIALLHESVSRIVQKTTGYSRKEQTLTTHNALSVPTASHALMIRFSSGRVTAASWNIFDTREKFNE